LQIKLKAKKLHNIITFQMIQIKKFIHLSFLISCSDFRSAN